MRWVARLRRRLRLMLDRDAGEREIDDEIRFHLEMEAEELARFGRSDAARLARLRFGGVDRYKEEAREARVGRWWEELRQDTRYARRVLARSRGFAVVAVLPLAVGIGANTAIFSVVRGVLLEPLPYPRPEQLVALHSVIRGSAAAVSAPDFVDWRAQSRSFSGLAAYFLSTTNLTGSGEPERLTQARVSANFFDILGVRPELGRAFRRGEDDLAAPRVAILSDGLWRRRFGADSTIVGRTILLDDFPTTVIGVASSRVALPRGVDLWLTTRFDARDLAPSSRGARWLDVLGRLANGHTLGGAVAEMNTIATRLATADPRHNTDVATRVESLDDDLVGSVRAPLLVLLGAVAFVLVIACVNVASLSLGRTAARDSELAVRAALGAGRRRIARQILTESIVLSLCGGGAGVVLAAVLAPALVALAPAELSFGSAAHLDALVLAVAFALTLLSGILFGVLPALHASRRDVHDRLRSGGRGHSSGAGGRLRRILVVAEIALAIALLAGAGLLARSFERLTSVDPGFQPNGVAMFSLSLSPVRYPDGARQAQFATTLLARLERLPGVTAAGISFSLPLTNGGFGLTFAIDGRPETNGEQEPRAQVRVASPDYFRAMGIPLLRGRGFTLDDRAGEMVLVISRAAAERYWPNENPIGQRLSTGWHSNGRQFAGRVVGVVGDVRQFSLAADPQPEIYAPLLQWPLDELSVVVRTREPPNTFLATVRDVVRELDPLLPIYDARPMADLVRESVAARRFYAILLVSFATLALLLAAVGIYGVIAYAVQQRRRELAIRVALGASRERIISMVMTQGIALAVGGVAVGVAAASVLTRVLHGQLYGVSATDPATFVAVPLLLLLVAVGACLVPTLRALRVDPAAAIRADD